MTAAAVMRPSHRAARVTAAPAAALRSLSREVHDTTPGMADSHLPSTYASPKVHQHNPS